MPAAQTFQAWKQAAANSRITLLAPRKLVSPKPGQVHDASLRFATDPVIQTAER